MESRTAIIKSLIISANMFLEIDDSDSSDEEHGSIWLENSDDGLKCLNTLSTSTATVAALQIPCWKGDQYKIHLKISAETFEFLYQLIGSKLCRVIYGMPMVDARLQLMVAIHKLTSLKTYRIASEMFNLKKSTGYCCTNRVISALNSLAPAFIKWPSPSEVEKISRSFQEMSGFPGIIGDLGQYIFNELEVTEKERNSGSGIVFQAICDHTRKFTRCHIASTNTVTQDWLSNCLEDATMFPNNTHLISTSAYTLHENLMVPYSYEEGNHVQKNFNKKLHSASVIAECLGDLLGRFESLRRGCSITSNPHKYVVACCVLHNICQLKGDAYTGEQVEIENMRYGSVPFSPCSSKAKMKRDNIALKLPNG